MKLPILLLSGFLAFWPLAGSAQTVEGVQAFSQPEGSWKRETVAEENAVNPQQRFIDEAGKFAIDNIVKAEQVFVTKSSRKTTNTRVIRLTDFRFAAFAA